MRKVSKNIIIALMSKIFVILSGVIAQGFILNSYGSEINGLTSTITQFMSYFILLEAGLGTASIQALYKPLVQRDKQGINGIINATRIQYMQIGFVFTGLWIVTSLCIPVIVTSSLEFWFVSATTLLTGIGTIFNYFFIGKYTVLLNADKKVYIINILDAIIATINCILKVLIINAGYSVIVVQLSAIGTVLLRLLILNIYFRKNYKFLDKSIMPNKQATKKRWNVLIHNIVGMVTNHTDVIILSVLSTLQNVSVYSVYNYIFSNLSSVIQTAFSNAPLASFGQMQERKDKNLNAKFQLYENIYIMLMHILLVSTALLTLPFIKLYTSGVKDIDYLDTTVALLFVLVQYLNLVRVPSALLITSGGYFKETQKGAIIEAIINLSVSIPMFFVLGLKGLLIGTVVALTYRSIDLVVFAYRNILQEKKNKFVLMLLNHFMVALLILFTYRHLIVIDINNWLTWITVALITVAFVAFIYLLNMMIMYRSSSKFVWNGVSKLLKQKR